MIVVAKLRFKPCQTMGAALNCLAPPDLSDYVSKQSPNRAGCGHELEKGLDYIVSAVQKSIVLCGQNVSACQIQWLIQT